MVGLGGALLCPHEESRVPEAGESAPAAPGRPRTTVYVDGGKGTMGLCLDCKRGMERLIARRAPLDAVVGEFLRLGYSRRDAAQFHAEMGASFVARLWRSIVNRALVHQVSEPRRGVLA